MLELDELMEIEEIGNMTTGEFQQRGSQFDKINSLAEKLIIASIRSGASFDMDGISFYFELAAGFIAEQNKQQVSFIKNGCIGKVNLTQAVV